MHTEVKQNSEALQTIEFALYLHSHIYENIKFVETKNSIVLGAAGGLTTILLAGFLPLFDKISPHWFSRTLFVLGASGLCVCWLLSMWYSLLSLTPQLTQSPQPSFFYFHTLTESETDELTSRLLRFTNSQLVQEVMEHTCTLASIAKVKYQRAARSLLFFKVSLAFVLPFIVSMIV